MTEKPEIPVSLREYVLEVTSPVAPHTLDDLDKLSRIQDRSYRLRTLIQAWKEQQNSDRQMRQKYANWLLVVIRLQLFVVYTAFFLIGASVLKVDQWVATIFISGVFAETSALALIVVKYLFPASDGAIFNLINNSRKDDPRS